MKKRNLSEIICFIIITIMFLVVSEGLVKAEEVDFNIDTYYDNGSLSVVVNLDEVNLNEIIVATVEKDGVMVCAVKGDAEKETILTFPKGITGNLVKVFFWNSLSQMSPLRQSYVLDIGTNKFYGKTLYVDGDSICYGNGYKGGFGKIIADKYGMLLTNVGVGGATISEMGTTSTVKYGTEMDWENTQYYLKFTGYDPFADKSAEGFAYPITQDIYENGFGKYPIAYKMIDGILTELEYSETMPRGRFYVKFDVPTYDNHTVAKYYRMWSTNAWLWEAYNSGFKGVHESGEATIATARHWISSSIENVDSSADYIIFEGGINDYLMNRPLGKMGTDVVDTTTVIGGLEYICRTLLEKCPDSKIIYIITPKAREYTTKPNGNAGGNKTWQDYHDAIKSVLEKYDIDYVDLFETEFDTVNEEYLQYTHNLDGVHPTKEGYELFYIPYIEKAMAE